MTQWLRQVTTGTVTLRLGPFIQSADGFTAQTGLTITQANTRISKNGAAFAAKSDTSSSTEDSNGWYAVTFNSTDFGTPGHLDLSIQVASTLPYFKDFMIVSQQEWDSLFGADVLQVHAVEIANNLITDAAINADAITAAKVAADVHAETAAAVVDLDRSGHAIADSFGEVLSALPTATAGTTGGLALYDNLFAGVLTGTVSDATPTAGGFDATGSFDISQADVYAGGWLLFISGSLISAARKISANTAANPVAFSFSGTGAEADVPFPFAPANGDQFIVFGYHGT